MSQNTEASPTAQESGCPYHARIATLTIRRFIASQLQLEADAREALPYVRTAHLKRRQ